MGCGVGRTAVRPCLTTKGEVFAVCGLWWLAGRIGISKNNIDEPRQGIRKGGAGEKEISKQNAQNSTEPKHVVRLLSDRCHQGLWNAIKVIFSNGINRKSLSQKQWSQTLKCIKLSLEAEIKNYKDGTHNSRNGRIE